MKRRKIKKPKSNSKIMVITISILFFITIAGFYLFNLYINIDLGGNLGENQYTASKTTQQIEEKIQEDRNITDIIEEVSKSVVGISKLKENGNSIFVENNTQKLGLGTGIILSENGYILTNQHVAGGKYSMCYVTLENGKDYQATVVWSDIDLDLAIIKINAQGLAYAKLGDSNTVRIAQTVYAIGNPIGFEFKRTVTSGIISAVNRTIKIEEEEKSSYMEDLIQTDATINPGNSGGPLINTKGEVIGINSVKITSAEGIGFAIPINIIKPIIESFNKTGEFEEASIGIFSYDKEVVPYLDSKLEFDEGIYVAQVIANSPAEIGGIKQRDIIIKIDDISLNKMSELRQYIYTKKPGDEVTLLVKRNGINSPVKITLGKK